MEPGLLPQKYKPVLARKEVALASDAVKLLFEERLRSDFNLFKHTSPFAFRVGTGVNSCLLSGAVAVLLIFLHLLFCFGARSLSLVQNTETRTHIRKGSSLMLAVCTTTSACCFGVTVACNGYEFVLPPAMVSAWHASICSVRQLARCLWRATTANTYLATLRLTHSCCCLICSVCLLVLLSLISALLNSLPLHSGDGKTASIFCIRSLKSRRNKLTFDLSISGKMPITAA